MQACTKTHHFEIKNAKNFLGRGTPPQAPMPTPRRLRRLDLRAYGAQAQRDASPPQKKILVYSYGLRNRYMLGG